MCFKIICEYQSLKTHTDQCMYTFIQNSTERKNKTDVDRTVSENDIKSSP